MKSLFLYIKRPEEGSKWLLKGKTYTFTSTPNNPNIARMIDEEENFSSYYFLHDFKRYFIPV